MSERTARYKYTLAALNKRAAVYGLGLVKGVGRFYWLHDECSSIEPVYMDAFSHAPEELWDRELEAAIVQVEEWKKERSQQFSWIKTREESLCQPGLKLRTTPLSKAKI